LKNLRGDCGVLAVVVAMDPLLGGISPCGVVSTQWLQRNRHGSSTVMRRVRRVRPVVTSRVRRSPTPASLICCGAPFIRINTQPGRVPVAGTTQFGAQVRPCRKA
jgi:hypothetical protein